MAPTPAPRAAALILFLALLSASSRGPEARVRDTGAEAGLLTLRPSATQVLARITTRDAMLDSYSVPVHVDVHLHKLITFHFGLNGMQYYKRPDRVALELREMPAPYRRLFAEIGTPLTWADTYVLELVDATTADGSTIYKIEGTPRRPGQVTRVMFEIADDASAPLRSRWFCKDGTIISMTIDEAAAGPYQLPKRVQADLTASGFRIHAVLDYGTYAANAAVADAVFGANR